ncbi:patatin-like phospholipase family protein [Paenibacillus alkaliterrae]|uniref:patatin-like phospholipase family protein n=1 Tax=Paenibacillus alkaliterrae TaxID=320909 RepID=UPI001F262719|nr:patatin-like phospholipase family protein [Paenibacillus alkaliterrae]MCF2940935.1 patatin-like phospholipase family protein [Paenibacillus alkaliterrae]
MKADAVFEGGGVRGIAFIGAIQEMEAKGYEWERLAGTSAGAVVAALLACGYSSRELVHIMKTLDYSRLLGRTWVHYLPIVGKALPLLFKSGIYLNTPLEDKLTYWLKRKGVSTFGDLPEGKLKIIASDISSGKMLILPDDLPRYHISRSQFPVAAAVRMSTTIPYFFQPYRLKTKLRRKPYYILDGGLLSNYPIWIFDVEGMPRWPTFGFRLLGEHAGTPFHDISGPFSMFRAMFQTMLKAHDQRHVDKHSRRRTVFIPTGKVSTTQFDLGPEERDFLYQSGQETARKFLSGWDYGKYVEEFRVSGEWKL